QMWENRKYAAHHPGAFLPGHYGSATTSAATACTDGHDIVLVRASPTANSSVSSMLALYEMRDVKSPKGDRMIRASTRINHMTQADLAVDPVRSIAVLTGDSNSRPLAFWDLKKAGSSNRLQTISMPVTDGTWVYAPTYGMDFDP